MFDLIKLISGINSLTKELDVYTFVLIQKHFLKAILKFFNNIVNDIKKFDH